MCRHLINPKLDDLNFINYYLKIKDKWALNAMCHHIISVLKWTHVKWSMNVPWCAMCHPFNGRNFNNSN